MIGMHSVTMVQIEKNRWLQLRMGVVMTLLAVLIIGFSAFLGFILNSFIFSVIFVVLFSGLQLVFSKKLALKSIGAEKVSNNDFPMVHESVNKVSQQAEIPKPDVAVANNSMMNAFAAGRSKDDAVICVTTGLINRLSQEELEGVIAHEAAHIKNRDALVMTVAGMITVISGFILRWGFIFGGNRENGGYLSFLLVSILTYALGFLLMRALSRYREYVADKAAAKITGNPLALSQALKKIDGSVSKTPDEDLRKSQGISAMMIFPSKSKISSVLSTHPPTQKRIERLQDMS